MDFRGVIMNKICDYIHIELLKVDKMVLLYLKAL